MVGVSLRGALRRTLAGGMLCEEVRQNWLVCLDVLDGQHPFHVMAGLLQYTQ